jgi:hypothetical protein
MMMMMMTELIIYMMLNKKPPSITDRIIIHVRHYYTISIYDFCTILSIDDSAATTATATTTTDANVVSNENKLIEKFFFPHLENI